MDRKRLESRRRSAPPRGDIYEACRVFDGGLTKSLLHLKMTVLSVFSPTVIVAIQIRNALLILHFKSASLILLIVVSSADEQRFQRSKWSVLAVSESQNKVVC